MVLYSIPLCLDHDISIAETGVAFGDLTVIIGPQASGKSIFLRLFKLLQDMLWKDATLVQWGKRAFSLKNLMAKEGKTPEKAFYVPAQRVMTLDNSIQIQNMPKTYHWIATDSVRILSDSSEARLLAKAGLSRPRRLLKVG